MAILETEYQKNKRKRDAAIYRDFKKLSAKEGNQLCCIYDLLGEKYPKNNGEPLSRTQIITVINEQRALEKAV
jgi:hypothetical protein